MNDYPQKPENATHFQRHYGYEPATVLKWEWSTTFGRWGALVRFADGAEIYTYPRPDPTPEHEALAARDASLGVGHIWYKMECTAYRTYNPEDCTCCKKVPALRIGAPVRVKCHERAGERGIIVSEDRGLFVVRFPDMSTGRFTADELTVLE